MENTNFETRNIVTFNDYKAANDLSFELKEYKNAAGETKSFVVDNNSKTYYVSDKAYMAIVNGNYEDLMFCECSKDGSIFVPTIYTASKAAMATTIAKF